MKNVSHLNTNDIFTEEQRKFMNTLFNEIKKSENISQKNKPKMLKELKQDKVLLWFFKLSLEDRIRVSTISNQLLSGILLHLYSLYEKDNGVTFKPTKEMAILLGKETNNENSFFNTNENEEEEANEYLHEKFFIQNNQIVLKDKKAKKYRNLEKEFLEKYCNIISTDINTFSLSEEFLSDSGKFKKIFKSFSYDAYFSDLLLPKDEEKKIFTLPSWMSTKDNLSLCQIIIGFFEQNIILNYEYCYYNSNRIYHTKNDIIDLYKEINNTVDLINNESCNINNIFSQQRFNESIKDITLKNESSEAIFNELKNHIKENNKEKDKLIRLLKTLSFLNLKEVNNGRYLAYKSYKKNILNYLINEIADELIICDQSKKYKTANKKNKKKKEKDNKETKEKEKENENNKQEEEQLNNKEEKEKQLINEVNEKEENNEETAENEKKEKENETIVESKNNKKKCKEFHLFPVNQEKKKEKKKKANKKTKKTKEQQKDYDDKLIRITSYTSLSTHKSSEHQENLSTNDNENENDSSSIISDISPNHYQYITNNNNNCINDINNNKDGKSDGNNETTIIAPLNVITINKRNDSINNNNHQNFIKKNNIGNYKNYNNNQYYNCQYYNNNNNYNCNYNYNYNSNNYFSNNFFLSNLNYYYKLGIDNYCSIINTNLAILNEFKEKYLKIMFDMIQNNLKNKFMIKFGKYGSYATDLSIEGSDIDICIFYQNLLNDNTNFGEELYNLLKNNEKTQNLLSYETKKIFDTSIPRVIVKIKINEDKKRYLNNYGNLLDYEDMNIIKIDFSFNDNIEYYNNNMNNVNYIKSQLAIFPQIKPIVQITKRFLRRQKMNEVFTGGISSYTLFLMVLNTIKRYQLENPNQKIENSQLLFATFQKFAQFNFVKFGINKDNLDFFLGFENENGIPYIINPLTGINLCKVGSCKGFDINNTFYKGHYKLQFEINSFRNIFSGGINPFTKFKSIDSIVNLLK